MSRRVSQPTERGARSLVVAASLLVATVSAAWSVVLPIGEGPDEPAHLGLVLHLADGEPYPRYDALQRTEALERLCETFVAAVRVCPLPGEEVTADAVRVRRAEDAPDRADRPAFDDDGGEVAVAELNQMPQHPPLYYASMAVALKGARTVVGGPMALDRELALLRLLNAMLVVPVPALAWLTARRLRAGKRVATSAALLAAALPMLTATAGVLNNDNLLTLLGALAAPLLASLATGDRSRRTIVAVGAVIGLALLTKAFAVVLLPALVLACWVGSRPVGRSGGAAQQRSDDSSGGSSDDGANDLAIRLRRTATPLAATSAIAGVVAGWWYLDTWRHAGSPTPSADADRYTEALRPPGFTPDIIHFVDAFSGRFAERFWGSFGWYSARLPGWTTVALTIASVVLVVAGLITTRTRRGPLVVLVLPSLLLLALTASRAWTLHERSGQYPFIQGRYLLAGVVGLAVLAATGWVGLVRVRRATAILAVLAVVLQVGALTIGLGAFWGGGVADRVDAVDAWSGLPSGLPVALLAAAVASAAALLVVAALDGDGADPDDEAHTGPQHQPSGGDRPSGPPTGTESDIVERAVGGSPVPSASR